MSDCIFCKIVNGEIPALKVFENESAIVIDDIQPAAKVHALIITKTHYSDILSADINNDADLMRGVHDAVREVARIKEVDGSGFRLICNCGDDGGQTVPHLHFHIIGGEKLRTSL